MCANKKRISKENRINAINKKQEISLKQKLMRAAMAVGFVVAPWAFRDAEAADSNSIQRVDGGTIVSQGTVHNIYAAKVENGNAVNRFSNFSLANNNVANMYFNTQNNPTSIADNLFNFVNSQINIAGTVNAIKGNSIGGHMYFLSPSGMVVSSSGVINAASLTVMTPTQSWFNANAGNFSGLDAISKGNVPINTAGTITVYGKLNAKDSIELKAATINVGREDNASQAAVLKTGVKNFTNLVKLTPEQQQASGISELVFQEDVHGGDIVLAARNNFSDNHDKAGTNKVQVNAIVNIDGGAEINAAGAADITAFATSKASTLQYTKGDGNTVYYVNDREISKKEYETYYSGDHKTGENSRVEWGSKVDTFAQVNISDSGALNNKHTTIEGNRVNIEASSINYYDTNNNSFINLEKATNYLASLILSGNGIDVNYALEGSKAEVNIGSNTVVKAKSATEEFVIDGVKYKTLNINAYADNAVSLGANAGISTACHTIWNAFFKKLETNLKVIPGAGIIYGKANTSATVNINTKLESEGSIGVHAKSDTALAAKNVVNGSGVLEIGILIADGTNDATVNITKEAELAAKKAITIDAKAVNSLKLTNSVSGRDDSAASLAVSDLNYHSNAYANIAGNIHNDNSNISIAADSTYKDNTFTAENVSGSSSFGSLIKSVELSSTILKTLQGKLPEALKDVHGKELDNDDLQAEGVIDKNSKIYNDYFKALSTGITFNYVNEGNKAEVNLANTANIKTSLGAINISADAIYEDTNISATGTSNNYQLPKEEGTHSQVLFNGSILIAKSSNEANVNISGAKDNKNVQLNAQNGDVNIAATAKFKYVRYKKVFENLSNVTDKIKNSFLNVKDQGFTAGIDSETLDALEHYINQLKNDVNSEKSHFCNEDGSIKDIYENDENGYGKIIQEINKYAESSGLNSFVNAESSGYFKFTYNGKEYTIDLHDERKKNWFNKFIDGCIDLKNAAVAATNLPGAITSLLKPASYVNYYNGAATTGQSGPKGAKAGVAATVGYTKLTNKANVNIGKVADISAKGRNAKLGITASADSKDISLDGFSPLSGGGDKGAGSVVVGTHFLDNNAIIFAAEDAKLSSSNDLNIRANGENMHVGVSFSMPSSDGVAAEGSVIYLQAKNNNIISIDDESQLIAPDITIKGINNSRNVNVVGGIAMGGLGGVGIAVGVINQSRDNLVIVADNDNIGNEENEDDTDESKARKLIAQNSNLNADEKVEYFGTAQKVLTTGKLATDQLSVSADTSGYTTNVVADIGISMNDDSDSPTTASKAGSFINNALATVSNLYLKLDDAIAKRVFKEGKADWLPLPTNAEGYNPQQGMTYPKFTLGAAGSLGLNIVSGKTATVLNGAKIQSYNDNKANNINLHAKDTSGIYAIDGSVTFSWNIAKESQNKGHGSNFFAGVAAVNKVTTDVTSAIRNSKINDNSSLSNTASRDGAIVAAGAALSVTFDEGTKSKGGAIGASVNVGKVTTVAELEKNSYSKGSGSSDGQIINAALSKDLQVTGALNVTAAKSKEQSAALGLTAAWSTLNNEVKANVKGGEYTLNSSFKNYAQTNLTQISAGLGLGCSNAATASNVTGIASITTLKNDIQANIQQGAVISARTIENYANDEKFATGNSHANSLAARGIDVNGETYINAAAQGASNDDNAELDKQIAQVNNKIAAQETKISGKNNEISQKAAAIASEQDADKKKVLENEKAQLEAQLRSLQVEMDEFVVNKTELQDKKAENDYLSGNVTAANDNGAGSLKNRGNTIVAAALEVVGTGGGEKSKAGGAAIAFSNIKNDFTATIDSTTLTSSSTEGVKNLAKSNTLSVGVAVGANGTAGSIAGGGSAVINILKNNTISTIKNSTIDTYSLASNAYNTNKTVGVAGNIGVGKTAMGLDITYNYMNTNTGAYLLDSNVYTTISGGNTNISISADDKARMYAIALGTAVSTEKKAANGSLAFNVGHNNVEAVASSSHNNTLGNVNALNISAHDDTYIAAAAGGLSISKGVAAGGSFAHNQIGDLWLVDDKDGKIKSDGKKQTNKAALVGYSITTTDDGVINVTSSDTAKLTTVSFGAALSNTGFSFEGANAADIVKKATNANVTDVVINGDTKQNRGNLKVQADSSSKVNVVSAVVSGSLKGATFGVAASENYMYEDTVANITGGKYYLQDVLLKSTSNVDLLSVGAGAKAGTSSGLGGTVLVNILNNNTSAVLGNSTNGVTLLNASGNVGVVSNSEDRLRNYGGLLSISVGGTAGVGASIVYNEIRGTTQAVVDNADVDAVGSNDRQIVVNEDEEENAIAYTGLVVAAKGRHELQNIMATVAGGGGEASLASGVGTINVDKLDGATKALITDSNVNVSKNASIGQYANVNVLAKDYTKTLSIGASAGILIGTAPTGLGIGITSDNLIRKRLVEAGIDGKTAKKTVNANKLQVNADSEADLKINAAGIAVAGISPVSIAGAANVSVGNFTNLTKAYINNINGTNNGFAVKANQDTKLLLTTNGIAASFSEGVAVGATMNLVVVDDTSATEATITNSTIEHYTDNVAEDSLKAEHYTKFTEESGALSVAGAVGGVGVGVVLGGNNLDEHVTAKVSNSTIGSSNVKAKSFTQMAKNSLSANYINVAAAGGGITGIGVGIDVNIIDSTVNSVVDNVHIFANETIDVQAIDNRDVKLNAVNVGAAGVAGVNASVMVTTISDDADAVYNNDTGTMKGESEENDSKYAEVNITGSIDHANNAIASQNSVNSTKLNKYISKGGSGSYTTASSLSLKTRSNKDNKGVNVKITNSDLDGKNINVKTDAKTDANQRVIAASGSGIAGGGLTVNVLKNNETNKIIVSGSIITAQDTVALETLKEGTVMGEVYQGAVSGTVAINGALAFVTNKSKSGINILGNSYIDAFNHIYIKSNDTSTSDMRAVGVTVGGIVGGGVMVSRALDDSDITVTIQDSSFNERVYVEDEVVENGEASSDIIISSNKNNSIDNTAINGSGGYVGINGIFVKSEDKGISKVVTNNASLKAGAINISSNLNPCVQTSTGGVSVGVGTLGVAAVVSKATGISEVDINATSRLSAKNIAVSALVNKQDNKANIESMMIPIAAGGLVLTVNKANIDLRTTAGVKSEGSYIGDNVAIKADQQVLLKNKAIGVEGTIISAGQTEGADDVKLNTYIDAQANADSIIRNLEVNASSEIATASKALGVGFNGVGVGLASALNDDFKADTKVNMAGSWTLTGSAKINAFNKNKLDTHVDATKVILVGMSGSQLDNSESFATAVNLKNANISTKDSLDIAAATILDKKLELNASGYGAATAQCGTLNDVAVYKANVILDNTKLAADGAINISAYTSGKINDQNTIKSAGIANGAFTGSEGKTTYDNSIAIKNNSSIINQNTDKSITVATYDQTEVYYDAVANIQGGAIGSVTSKNTNKFNRNNIINLEQGSSINGNNDVNIYAGAKENGVKSNLYYTALADAYNHTVIALKTKPELDNKMKLNNQVKIQGNVISVCDTRLVADEGIATVTASSRIYKLLGGKDGKGSISSTVLGDVIPDEKVNNFVNITGKVTAGVYNDLKLVISGTAKTVNEQLDTSGITVIVEKGSEWFDPSSLDTGTIKIANTLYEQYNKLSENIKQYSVGSDQYNLLKNEMVKLLDEMVLNGFAQKDSNGKYSIVKELYEAVIKVPDIDVSGGSIYITTNKLQSTANANLTANGANALEIDNKSNLSLYVNNLSIKNPGGEIFYNNNNLTSKDFKGTIKKSGNGESSNIIVTSTGNRTDKDGKPYVPGTGDPSAANPLPAFTPNIVVFGNVFNASGNVTLGTTQAGVSIYVDEKARIAGQNIKILSKQGDVIQRSSGLLLVGTDPVSQYQFSKDKDKWFYCCK